MTASVTLRGYWNHDETGTGTRADATANALTLTNNNAVTNGTGVLNNASAFTLASSMSLSRVSSAPLQMGDIDFGISVWVKLTTKATLQVLVAKDGNASGQREYALFYNNASDRFNFGVFKPTDSIVVVAADVLGAVSTGVWYNVIAWHNAAADTVNIVVNAGTADSAATGGALQAASNGVFALGAEEFGGFVFPLDGLLDETALFTGVPSAADRTFIYGAGTPPAFAAWTASATGVASSSLQASAVQASALQASGIKAVSV